MLGSVFRRNARVLRLQRAQALLRRGRAIHGHARAKIVGLDQAQLYFERVLSVLQQARFPLDALHVGLGAIGELHVDRRGIRHPPDIPPLEVREVGFDRLNLLAQTLRLLREERGRLGDALLARLDVLVQVERHEVVRDLLRPLRIRRIIGDLERDRRVHAPPAAPVRDVGVDRRELDVPSHPVEDLFVGRSAAILLIQAVLFDELQQHGPRHHLLADDLDALVGEARDRGANEVGGHLLFLHQYRRRRAKDRRQDERHEEAYRGPDRGNREDLSLVTPQGGQILADLLRVLDFVAVLDGVHGRYFVIRGSPFAVKEW